MDTITVTFLIGALCTAVVLICILCGFLYQRQRSMAQEVNDRLAKANAKQAELTQYVGTLNLELQSYKAEERAAEKLQRQVAEQINDLMTKQRKR